MGQRWQLWLGLVVLVLTAPGCSRKAPGGEPGATTTPAADLFESTGAITRAQPKLPTVKLWVGAQELITEVASSSRELQTGMMFRTNIAENEAMLFVFPYAGQQSFWMKNTTVPLSAAYIGPEGVIAEIHPLKPLDERGVPSKSDRIQFVLETKEGWFARNNVSTGAVVRTERGTLQQTFFPARR